MNLKCLTGDLGFAAGTVLVANAIDTGSVKQYISWGLLEETTDKPTAEIAAGTAVESPIDDLSDEELAKLTDPEPDK